LWERIYNSMQSIKRLVYAKNNRVWSVKQTTPGSP